MPDYFDCLCRFCSEGDKLIVLECLHKYLRTTVVALGSKAWFLAFIFGFNTPICKINNMILEQGFYVRKLVI